MRFLRALSKALQPLQLKDHFPHSCGNLQEVVILPKDALPAQIKTRVYLTHFLISSAPSTAEFIPLLTPYDFALQQPLPFSA